ALYISGTLGDAALGLKLRQREDAFGLPLTSEQREFLLARYLYPEPRLALAPALASHASAAMDISDGLVLDLSRMCAASGCSAEVSIAEIPLSGAARAIADAGGNGMQTILTGGDDYEILAAVPPDRASAFEASSREVKVPVTRIGTVTEGQAAPKFKAADGSEFSLPVQGFEHFSV
ncbi:MAG: AIR synthase-related protein, partial [Rhodomicrobium sp.]